MRGSSLRGIAIAMAFALGIVAVGLAGSRFTSSTSASVSVSAASSVATLAAVHLGVDAATLTAEPDRTSVRVNHRRSIDLKLAVGVIVLLGLAVSGSGLTRWLTPPSEVDARSRILPRRAPQRAPPSLSLARS